MAVAGLPAPAPRLHRVHRGTCLRRGVAWSARCRPASPPRADPRPPRRPAVDRCGSRGRSRPSPARSTTLVGRGPGRPLRGGGLGGGRSARRRAASHLACRARPSTSPAGARRPGPDRATAVRGDHRGETRCLHCHARTSTTAEGTVLHVMEPALPAVARVRVTVAGGVTSGWRVDAEAARLPISWDPRQEPTLELTITCALAPENPLVPDGRRPPRAGRPEAGPLSTRLHVPARLRPRLSSLIDGVLDYVLGCTALTVASGERCILTDHRLLQLSWTRDAYYQALLLLAARHIEPRALTVVAEHLRWLWVRCDRGANGWARSHLPNGAVKDRAFQADQQLYPVLELLDYREVAGAWPEPPPGRSDWGERGRRDLAGTAHRPRTRAPRQRGESCGRSDIPAVSAVHADPALVHGHPAAHPRG